MMLSDVCRVHRAYVENREAQEDQNWHSGSPRHTTPLSRSKGQGHQAALLTVVLARQAAAAVGVGTCWP